MTHSLSGSFVGVSLALLITLGGCGGAVGTSGAGATATPRSTAASRGALTSASSSINSALNVVLGGSGVPALKLKATTDNSSDSGELNCAENEDGSLECDDGGNGGDETGDVTCDFDDHVTEEVCGDGLWHYAMNSDFTMTFEDFDTGNECGQTSTINGTVIGTIAVDYDECENIDTVTGTYQTSGLAVTLEDGTSYTVTFDLAFDFSGNTDTVSGEVCVNGECSDINSFDDLQTDDCTEAEAQDCTDQCITDTCGLDNEDEELTCEADCASSCSDDGGDTVDEGGGGDEETDLTCSGHNICCGEDGEDETNDEGGYCLDPDGAGCTDQECVDACETECNAEL